MEVLEVCDEELDGRRTLHARASIPGSVAIHAGSGSAAAQEVAKRGELLCQKMLPRVPIPRAPLGHWQPPENHDRMAYFVSLLRCAASLSSVLLAAKRDTDLVPYALLSRFFESTSSITATPRWLPFEPAVDLQSGAAFVGGGVSIGAASAKVEWTDTPPSPTMDDAAYVLDLAPRVQAPDADDMLTAVAASTAQASCSFLHEVVALGLAENYARAHPGRRCPTGRPCACRSIYISGGFTGGALPRALLSTAVARALSCSVSNPKSARRRGGPGRARVERPSPRRRKRNAPRKKPR